MNRKHRKVVKIDRNRFYLFFCTSLIPVLLLFASFQVNRFSSLRKDVLNLEKKQEELVETNKRLITDISVLSSSERIETIAEELGMRRAESNKIVRVKMEGSD
jgi:cell division protein FtsL